ncbi:glycosyltransferase family 4 protein [Arthrobacter sp. TMT4-20]
MKILMPSRILDRQVGGNTTYARRIAEGLMTRGHDVESIQAGFSPHVTAIYETAAGLLRRPAGDVLHYVADTGPMLSTRSPSVVTVHGIASLSVPDVRSKLSEKIWRTRVKRAVASCDHVITVSESSARDIRELTGLDSSRLTVIPHGIDTERFRSVSLMSDQIRLNLPARFALYVGNIEPRKNLTQLCRAFSSPVVRALDIPLVIVGKPAWDSEEAMAAIAGSKNVRYLGFVSEEDKISLMQACSLFVFPSLYEGFGFPVLEAMAAGAVVASSRRGSLEDVAGPALVLDITDLDSLVSSLEQALTDSAARAISLKAGKSWLSSFDWDRSVEDHLRVYRRVQK